MEKDVEVVLQLFRQGLSEPNETKSLSKIFEAVKAVSSALPFSINDHLTCHPQVLKMLIVCSPLNGLSMTLLLETLLDKFKDKEYVIFTMWKIFENIAQLQLRSVGTILTRKIIDFDPESSSRQYRLSRAQQQYLQANVWEIKRTVIGLIPHLFKIIHSRSPMQIKQKLQIFKLFKSQCKNAGLLLEISRVSDQMRSIYAPETMGKQTTRGVQRTERKKYTTRKIMPQNKFYIDRPLIEEYTKNKNQQLLTLVKTQPNVEAFLSYIIKPDALPLQQKVWGPIGNKQVELQTLRMKKALQVMKDPKYFRKMVATCPQIFHIFFTYIDKRNAQQLSAVGIKSLLDVFMKDDAAMTTCLMMKSNMLQNFYPYCEDKIVYDYFFRVLGFVNVQQLSSIKLKQIYYRYLLEVDFFHLLICNMYKVRHDKLPVVNSLEMCQLENSIKNLYYNKKKPKATVISQYQPTIQVVKTPFFYSTSLPGEIENKTTFFKSKGQTQISSKEEKRVVGISEVSRPSNPPYTMKEYRGYYSTSPLLNFFSEQPKRVNTQNESWHHTNCQLYYEILNSILTCPQEVPNDILRTILPNEPKLIQNIFLILRKYTSLLVSHPNTNSAKATVKILNILLQDERFSNQSALSLLCEQYNSTLYPIICKLFQKSHPPTRIQGINIVKTLGEDILDVVQLLLNFVQRIEVSSKQNVLDSIQQNLWYILMLWFFDSMINNIYQTLFYQIFEQLFQFGSEYLLIKVLFKYNLVSCLHNAYNDIVKQRVLMADWHIQSFYLYIKKLHKLVAKTCETRPQLTIMRQNLAKMLAWHLLSKKLGVGLYTSIDQSSGENSTVEMCGSVVIDK